MSLINMIKSNPWMLSASISGAVALGLFVMQPSYIYSEPGKHRSPWMTEFTIALFVFIGLIAYFAVRGQIQLPAFLRRSSAAIELPVAEMRAMSARSINDLLSPDQFHA